MSERPERIDWNLVVNAALCRMRGLTQPETAEKVNRSARTIRNWEDEDWWSDAVSEARSTWFSDIIREARAALYLQLKEGRDPVRAMQVLERTEPELAPAAQRLEHSGPEGGPIEVDVDDARQRLERRLTDMATRRAEVSGPKGNGAGD